MTISVRPVPRFIMVGEGGVWTLKVVENFDPVTGSGAVRLAGGKVWVSAHDNNTVRVVDPKPSIPP